MGSRSLEALITALLLPYSGHPLLANALHLLLSTAVISQGAALMSFTNNAAGVQGRQLVNGVAVTVEALGAWDLRWILPTFKTFWVTFRWVFHCFLMVFLSCFTVFHMVSRVLGRCPTLLPRGLFARGKACGPIACSYLFAWSLGRFGRPGHAFVFVLLSVLSSLQLLWTLCLPGAVDGTLEHVPVATEPPSEARGL